ncbi:GntR family transcriptional regulator [Paracoccus sp. Z118]|uniref:GntR family transcriptional regulator n=1 Tax=Paracoccus sp. Z118 TaxID=2851017 RepID=UPI001C2BFA79|nr:GntR family transcriptional regulator [Paracoccus sp. Z118]MBV0890242.1 GntR family transcriptional regulator [Paracoccus sp. Z118]
MNDASLTPAHGATDKPPTSSEIGERIWLAIAERRLRPGTRLKEEQLAEIFGVSRARIRQALAGLASEGLVQLLPNRGSVVAAPTVEEAGDVFFTRKLVEERIIERLTPRITPRQIAELRKHVARERAAAEADAVSDVIRLSGGFHMSLAELLGSEFLISTLRDLISRCSLITAVYRDSAHYNCGPDEHSEIIDCLAAGDAGAAMRVMRTHLDHITTSLDLDVERQIESDLKRVLG